MTEPADPAVHADDTTVGADPNASALLGEAANKSGMVWVDVPGERAHLVWHVWSDGVLNVVSGPGEQHLPWLPPEVVVTFRSKDTGGRLLSVRATTAVLDPGTPAWDAAVERLAAARLNATDDLRERWAREDTVHELTAYGTPIESPGHFGTEPGRVVVAAGPGTTVTWRPWHLRGRPQRRRRAR